MQKIIKQWNQRTDERGAEWIRFPQEGCRTKADEKNVGEFETRFIIEWWQFKWQQLGWFRQRRRSEKIQKVRCEERKEGLPLKMFSFINYLNINLLVTLRSFCFTKCDLNFYIGDLQYSDYSFIRTSLIRTLTYPDSFSREEKFKNLSILNTNIFVWYKYLSFHTVRKF